MAEVVGAGDGRAYAAFLTTRVETPAMADFSWEGRRGAAAGHESLPEPVPCPEGD